MNETIQQMDNMFVAWMIGVGQTYVLEDVELVHRFQASIRIGSQNLQRNMAGWLGAALITIINHVKTGEDLRQIFGQPESKIHAVAEFGNDLVFVVEVFAKMNRMVATKTVAIGVLFRRHRRRVGSGMSIARNQPREWRTNCFHFWAVKLNGDVSLHARQAPRVAHRLAATKHRKMPRGSRHMSLSCQRARGPNS